MTTDYSLVLFDLDGTLLAELAEAGVKLAVVSNKFQEGTDYLIRKFFPAVPFSAILGNRPGFPLKPDPAIVQEALTLSGVPADRAVMVGDSATDMLTAAMRSSLTG